MADQTDPQHRNRVQNEIAELVRRELLQVSKLQQVEEKLKIAVEKASKITPLPHEPELPAR